MQSLFAFYMQNLSSVDVLAFSELVNVVLQTLRDTGDLQIWRNDTGQLMSVFSVGAQVCSLILLFKAHLLVKNNYALSVDCTLPYVICGMAEQDTVFNQIVQIFCGSQIEPLSGWVVQGVDRMTWILVIEEPERN